MIRLLALAAALSLPVIARAATLRDFVYGEFVPFADAVVQLLFALAFLFFLIGVVRFNMSPSAEGRETGKKTLFWGIIALVVLFGTWGFVRLLLSVLPGATT